MSSPPPPYFSGAPSAHSPAAFVFADSRLKSSSGMPGASGSIRCSSGTISSRMKRRTCSRRIRSSSGRVKPGNIVMGRDDTIARHGRRDPHHGRRRHRHRDHEPPRSATRMNARPARPGCARPSTSSTSAATCASSSCAGPARLLRGHGPARRWNRAAAPRSGGRRGRRSSSGSSARAIRPSRWSTATPSPAAASWRCTATCA